MPERVRRIERPYPGGESHRDVVERVRASSPICLRGTTAPGFSSSRTPPRWAPSNLLLGAAPEGAIVAPFEWQEGWTYRLD